jgi:hypothetical protein
VSNVSAHYVVRQSDGQIAQMVRNKDIAWHAGNWWYNQRSIGIEHEGIHNDPDWNTPALLRGSADLTRFMALKYDIPRTRDYVLGHYQVASHKPFCPGPHFKWDTYMQMVQLDSSYLDADFPLSLYPGQQAEVVVRFRNNGDLTWDTSGDNPVYLGTQMPQDRSSDFYTPGDWVSPNRASAASSPVNPGQTGEFRFTVTAPYEPGNYAESFQLVKEGVTWFGPVMTLNMEVEEKTVVVDNKSSNTRYVGAWNSGAYAGRYGEDYRWMLTNPNQISYALYYLDVPEDGYYDVYAWWNQGSNRSTAARFQLIATADDIVTKEFNQQTDGSQWNLIERVYLTRGSGLVRVFPSGQDGSVVIADAIRAVGPFDSSSSPTGSDTPIRSRRVPIMPPANPLADE